MNTGAHVIELALIDIPDKRWRPVSKKVEEIAQSMLEFGQLQPIILRPDSQGRFVLVDGLHRITAALSNGKPTIEAIFRDEADPLFLREIELEVNIRRAEMTWQEKQFAIAELHKMKMERNPNWTQRDTARAVETQQGHVAEALKLTEMMKLFPELSKAKSAKQALSWMQHKAENVLRVHAVMSTPQDYSSIEERLWLGDSVELIKSVPAESITLILTDPPFGIDYDTRRAALEEGVSAYKDSEEMYERLLTMAGDLYRVLKPKGWLTWFLGMHWYERCRREFEAIGFLVDEIPVVWDRSAGNTYTTRPDRYYARGYDIALHCLKGEPQMVVRGKPNVLHFPPVPTDEKNFLVERPVELYSEIIRRLTVKGETVADFFVGSGSVLAAAASLQRNFFGIEQNPERRAGAIVKIKAYTPS